MDIRDELELQDCPFCGGAALLEEEGGWCWYVMCLDCGAQTGHFEYKTPDGRADLERRQGRARGPRGVSAWIRERFWISFTSRSA